MVNFCALPEFLKKNNNTLIQGESRHVLAVKISLYFAALGQVMLYVDGMNGVINHNATIQWLYSLLSSKVIVVTHTICSKI